LHGARPSAGATAPVANFLSAYVEAMNGAPNYPDNQATAACLLDLFLLMKAFYEITYEAAYRPDWSSIPVRGVLDLLERRRGQSRPAPLPLSDRFTD
jgi:maltose alpha-D-glucosyltransferase/alpha-amylase